MAKPRAPRWLTESFAHGVDEREAAFALDGANPYGCWLAQFDIEERPCTDKLERVHIISRQHVESGLGNQFDWGFAGSEEWNHLADLIQIAEWDSRNARIGCEGHHRRFDSQATPRLYVPYDALPEHVLEFAEDYGLEHELEKKCPSPQTSGAVV